jgi:hypothetical protein
MNSVQAALRGIANVAVSVADDVSMLEEIKATFEALDENGDGRVPYSTFVEYLQSGGFDLTETEMDVLISQMDVEQAGCGAACFVETSAECHDVSSLVCNAIMYRHWKASCAAL